MQAIEASVALQPASDFAPFTIDASHFALAFRAMQQNLQLKGDRRLAQAA